MTAGQKSLLLTSHCPTESPVLPSSERQETLKPGYERSFASSSTSAWGAGYPLCFFCELSYRIRVNLELNMAWGWWRREPPSPAPVCPAAEALRGGWSPAGNAEVSGIWGIFPIRFV